jgi:5-methylcytosine-specific restriction endonuclease McrA
MATYPEYLASPAWQRTRRQALLRADFTCARCRATTRLQVHHVTYQRLGDEWPDDLEVLCAACHHAAHFALRNRAAQRAERHGQQRLFPRW